MTSNRASLRLLTAAAVAACLATGMVAAARAQSLGDVARQEAARRKATPPSGKVYTNADLPAPEPVTAVRPAPEPATPAAGAKAAAGDAGKDAAEPTKKDEAYWRDRMKAARDGKARAESFAEALQTRINSLSADFVNRDDPAQRAVIGTDRQKAIDELARVKKEITDFTKAISDIQTEARREGVPAGWVR